MSYRIEYTNEARQDLRDIYVYIAEKLMVPEIAEGQVNRIMYRGRDIRRQFEETLSF